MKKYFKMISILALFFILIGCSSAQNTSSTKEGIKVQRHKKLSKQKSLEKYLLTDKLVDYSETEILTYIFTETSPSTELLQPLTKESGYKYENLDEIMEEMRSEPDYEETLEMTMLFGYDYKEAELMLKYVTELAIICNEYEGIGEYTEEQIKNLVDSDKRLKDNLKNMVVIMKSLALKNESKITPQQRALNKYIKEGILGEYTEDEMLAEYFMILSPFIEFKQIELKKMGYKYENLNEFMEFFKMYPEYKELLDYYRVLGINQEESENMVKSVISIYLLSEEYRDRGISIKENIVEILTKDERLKQLLKYMITIERSVVLRKDN